MMNSLLKNKYKNQTVWIIGKGPSIQYLKKENIGNGPIIALNDAIKIIEKLDLSNDLYSLQKDGCEKRKGRNNPKTWFTPDCDYSGEGCYINNELLTSVKKTTSLLLHDLESKYCFPDHPLRFVFNLKEIRLPRNEFSQIFALKIAQYMGCNKFIFVSFDAQAIGDNRQYFNNMELNPRYPKHKPRLEKYIVGLDCTWFTPKEN